MATGFAVRFRGTWPLAHWGQPKKITQMRAFLGICNYCSAYVQMYAEHVAPLTKLLQVSCEDGKRGSMINSVWPQELEKAFDHMKAVLLKSLSLQLLVLDKGLMLKADASDYAVDAVPEQVREDGSHVSLVFFRRVLSTGRRGTWMPQEGYISAIVCALRNSEGHI